MTLSRTWTFTLEDGNHSVSMNWSGSDFGAYYKCELTVDGAIVNTFKGDNSTGWEHDATFRIGTHVGVVRNTIRFHGQEATLLLDGVLLKAGVHTVIAQPGPPPVQPPAPPVPPPAQSAPSSQGSIPYYPVLPLNCPNCHAPLSMNTANWTGPMSASCPHCGSGVEIKWKKIGD